MSKVVIVCAPSGTGKTTIIKKVLSNFQLLEFSISACNRKAREGEVNGRDYYFISDEDFKLKIDRQEFLEWEQVYSGRYYGTFKSELQRIWDKGHFPLFDLDVKGGTRIKQIFGEKALAIFFTPPSLDELRNRLVNRGTDTTQEIEMRLERAAFELSFASQFDINIINDDIELATSKTLEAIAQFLGVTVK